MGCGKYAETFSIVGVNESEERYIAWMVDDVHELDLGGVKLAALLDLEEVVETRRMPCMIANNDEPK